MSKLVFIKNNAEVASVDGDSLSHIKYITHNRIGLYFDLSQSGAKTTLEVQLNVTSSRTNEAITSLTQQLSSRGVYVFTDAALNTGEYSSDGVERTSPAGHPSDFVTSIHSITYTEGVLATGPQGPTGPAGPQGPAGSDALALGGNDQTLTGARIVNMNGNDLDFKDGGTSKLLYDDSEDEWIFNTDVRFDGGSAGGFIKLRESSSAGTEGLILKAPTGNLASDVTLRLPNSVGSAGQFMKTDGSGNLSFGTVTDTNTSLSDTDQTLSGTRTINMNGSDLNFKDGSDFKLHYDDSEDEWVFATSVRFDQGNTGGEIKLREAVLGGTEGVILRAPTGNLASDVIFRLPAADGSANQLMKTDGSGNLSFTAPAKEYVSFNGGFFQNNTSFAYFSISSASTTESATISYLTLMPIGFACRLVDVSVWVQSGTARDETISAYAHNLGAGANKGSITASCSAGNVTVFTFNTSAFDFAAGDEAGIGWSPNTAPNGVSWKARFELL
tara:strand:- start:2955 stop:4454 length:1500 start_codon:yes stop_codon:yes gene_type:complete